MSTAPILTPADGFRTRMPARPPSDPQFAVDFVAAALTAARENGASDVHLIPGQDSLQMLWRLDGVLHPVAQLPAAVAPRLIGRLKVLADLLTYQTETPQEGRLRLGDGEVEMRISTFPTLFGEKAVVRLFIGSGRYRTLQELGLPGEITEELRHLLRQTGGVLLCTGPAGSGKTTTVYACLREILEQSGRARSLVTLEDPIEAALPGVAQSQINLAAGFDMATGLRSLLRQDPEVILVGEIRDRQVAETVFQAALTGHLVLSTFHAGSAAGAISRLSDMGIEPYLLRSGVRGIISQRLFRRLCSCATVSDDPDQRLGLKISRAWLPRGCAECNGTGFRGRIVLAELLLPAPDDLGRAILSRSDSRQLEALAVESGMVTSRARALAAAEAGQTSPEEIRRVLGFE